MDGSIEISGTVGRNVIRFLSLFFSLLQCAWDVYTPLRKIFAVPYDMELDRNTIAEIYSEGYSRVPVFERLPVRFHTG
jgi:CBS domain containing-hemolysin-like protein